jgi:hypothetical protein
MIFSKRKVHFSKYQLYWYCQSLIIFEDGSILFIGQKIFSYRVGSSYIDFNSGLSESWADLFGNIWRQLIRDYSQRFFFSTDRVAALAGITRWR